MPDKYDDAIAYLTERPEEIGAAWRGPNNHIAGCLFAVMAVSFDAPGPNCGCLTQIRLGLRSDFGSEHTHRIRADARLPDYSTQITPDHLPVFAEYQREADRLRAERKAMAT